MPRIVEYKKGDIIYQEGSFEMAMYRITKGTVSVIANYGEETEMLLVDQTEGQYFGHLELIEAIPRSATIIAKSDTILESCLLYTSPSPRDRVISRMPSSA